jgi:hypothetical protein
VDLTVGSAISPITAVIRDPSFATVSVDQGSQHVTLTGKTPGATIVTLRDARGVTRDVAVRVAYYAGTIAPRISLALTGDPAAGEFVREQIAQAVKNAAQLRPDAQALVTPDDVPFHGTLEVDHIASFDVPVLIQGNNDF